VNVSAVTLFLVLPLLSIAIVLTVVRLLRGPTLPNRVLALDQLTTLGIGIAVVYAVATNQAAFLDVAVVLALIAFLGTIAFAYYIQRIKKIG
jgi:multicomponent Na+:H+ antiporter subunit F